MTERENESWRDEVPEEERLAGSDRVDDEEWASLLDSIAEPSVIGSEMSVGEIRDAIEEDDHWEPGEAAPVGWRTASPSLVLSCAASVGSILLLLVGIVFFRPLPSWYLLVGLAICVGGVTGLFFHLPRERTEDGGTGAAV